MESPSSLHDSIDPVCLFACGALSASAFAPQEGDGEKDHEDQDVVGDEHHEETGDHGHERIGLTRAEVLHDSAGDGPDEPQHGSHRREQQAG